MHGIVFVDDYESARAEFNDWKEDNLVCITSINVSLNAHDKLVIAVVYETIV